MKERNASSTQSTWFLWISLFICTNVLHTKIKLFIQELKMSKQLHINFCLISYFVSGIELMMLLYLNFFFVRWKICKKNTTLLLTTARKAMHFPYFVDSIKYKYFHEFLEGSNIYEEPLQEPKKVTIFQSMISI